MRAILVAVCLLGANTAHAEKDLIPWYRGKYGKTRIAHMSITAGLSAVYLSQVTLMHSAFLPDRCRWCEPTAIDTTVRDAVVWKDVKRANFLSNMSAYVLEPLVGATLLVISTRDASASRLIDDILPVVETVLATQVIVGFIKLATARNRPSVHHMDMRYPAEDDDRLSFPSGHSSFGFAITTAAGMVCHFRQYWTEPYVWGSGIALSVTTEYLRMAADRHWVSDVFVGGLVGVGAGLVIPQMMRRSLKIAPVPGGAAVVGMF